jgi:hypothetical protein
VVDAEARSGMAAKVSSEQRTCARCGRRLRRGRAFAFRSPPPNPSPKGTTPIRPIVRGGEGGADGDTGSSDRPLSPTGQTLKCLRCALLHFPMLKRSLIAAVVVGTVLTSLNQGDTLLSGQWNNALYWKIPLTYCVPLIVATYGALTNSCQ